jgi:cytoskeleton protein RodZ
MSNSDGTGNMPVDSANLPAAVPDAAPQAKPAAPLTVGALLTETRAAAGRDLADVSREIRVPLRHLMAIEADDHRSLPALPYALGFVKSYARSVGLDAESVAAQFRTETSITPHVPTPLNLEPLAEARLPSRGVAWGSVAVLVLLVGVLGLYGSGVFDPVPPTPAVEAAAADPQPVAAAPVAAAPAEIVPEQPAPSATDAAPVPAGPAIPTAGPVVLVAREDVWVKIYDRSTGRRAFMGMLSAGQRYEVPANGPPLTLRAGRAGVVQVQVAGVTLPPLGGPVSTIDGVVLTAPALAERFAPSPAEPAVQAGASRGAAQGAAVPASAPARPTAAPIGD